MEGVWADARPHGRCAEKSEGGLDGAAVALTAPSAGWAKHLPGAWAGGWWPPAGGGMRYARAPLGREGAATQSLHLPAPLSQK